MIKILSHSQPLAGSAFDITSIDPECTLPTEKASIPDGNIGNFNVTIDDIFASSQSTHLSPTLQINDIKSQQSKDPFENDDEAMDDEELLEAFNQHFQSSSSPSTTNPIANPSPVLVLTGKVNTQLGTNDMTLPKFDLEFSFDDLENSDEPSKPRNTSPKSSDYLQT